MVKFYFTHKAIEDLTEIWNYIVERWSEKQADKYYDLLLASCTELAKKPDIGKKYEIVSPGLLCLRSGEHIIFYSIVSKNEIEIIRILHGTMDLKSRI
jgi:toxin ParE1/3/4